MPSPTIRFLARRCATAAAATLLAAPLLIAGSTTSGLTDTTDDPVLTAPVSPVASTVKVRLRAAVKNLRVASETPAGYDRAKFRHWIDADGDCQDTRDEVLKAESQVRVGGCDIRTGRWFSYYDRKTWRRSSDVDIDHLVPLKEAWDSGAKRWNADTRKRYANDLGYSRTLVAVTDDVNQSKSDQDPVDWMPRYGRCRYVVDWTAVKTRWSLKANRAEKNRLVKLAANCPNVVLTVPRARIAVRTSGTSGGGGGGTGAGTDPRYSTCTEAKSHGYGPYYRSRDTEYSWYDDRDNDGVVCE